MFSKDIKAKPKPIKHGNKLTDIMINGQIIDVVSWSTNTRDKSVNETWPPFFGVWKADGRVGFCGRMNAELKPYQCCVTTLNKTATGQASVAYEYVDVNNVINNMPTASH
ncbi:hypothetical protein BC833DRAFT_562756 [Globomyces pollinis-pini]|nr:hypothetical protein BC833DRAFT_562756 [Globomyces pollinis-pini]